MLGKSGGGPHGKDQRLLPVVVHFLGIIEIESRFIFFYNKVVAMGTFSLIIYMFNHVMSMLNYL